MTTYARIQDGLVAELFATHLDITQLFAPALVWVKAGLDVRVGWSFQAGAFSAPPPPAPPGVPQEVTRRQARQALLLRGKLAGVQPAIDAITDTTQRGLMQIEWDDSQVFQRARASLIQLGTALGLTSADLDDLFTFAATL